METELPFQQRLEAAYALAKSSLEAAFGEQRAMWINRLEAEYEKLLSLLGELWGRGERQAKVTIRRAGAKGLFTGLCANAGASPQPTG